ncbi:isochorismatase family protein [Tautonia sociabilis]|uniref:Isochorismatase family protein n=1 Tax=Tautonia sociabilis TaxID=2080755 RepID=A0A432ML49_9BACT|nr:isochorismatase family protein [Tautonia sociabilis]RUL88132.1 isochorismatase family protein [Tautonia sociabilis]
MSSPDRLTARDGGLLVVDLQAKILAPIRYGDLVVANAVRLIRAAQLLAIPVWATEQYPRGLGPTVPEVAELVPERAEKMTFHCCGVPGLEEQFRGRDLRHLTLAGIEAHVCVAQTALELIDRGFHVQVPADAIASRGKMDWEFALRRMERAGVVISTTEAVLFEWAETADRPEFKAVSALVRDFSPPRKRKEKDREKGEFKIRTRPIDRSPDSATE